MSYYVLVASSCLDIYRAGGAELGGWRPENVARVFHRCQAPEIRLRVVVRAEIQKKITSLLNVCTSGKTGCSVQSQKKRRDETHRISDYTNHRLDIELNLQRSTGKDEVKLRCIEGVMFPVCL